MNRLLSKYLLTPLLLRTPLSPNQVTLLSLFFGIMAGYLFSRGEVSSFIYAALAFEMAALLDNCDGDIARAKNMKSVFGGWLDVTADLGVDLTLFSGLTLGLLKTQTDARLVIVCGVLCLAGCVINFLLVVWEKVKGFGPAVFERPNPEEAKRDHFLFKVADEIREGDSSWFLVLLVFFGKTDYVLWGGTIYLQILWLSGLCLNWRWLVKPAFRHTSPQAKGQ